MGTNSSKIEKINIGCNGLIIKKGKILLGKRKNCYGEGTWGLPGGHLEYGEQLTEAVVRELKEELGIEAKDPKFLSIVDEKRPEEHYLQFSFLIEDFQGEIKLMEPNLCESWEYFEINDLPEVFPPHIKIIKAFKSSLSYIQ